MKLPPHWDAAAEPGLMMEDALLRLIIFSFDLEFSASYSRLASSFSSSWWLLGSTRTS